MSVIPHNPDFNLGVFQDKNLDNFLYDLSECIATENKAFPIAFEGFLNLVSYSVYYSFIIDFLLACSPDYSIHKNGPTR